MFFGNNGLSAFDSEDNMDVELGVGIGIGLERSPCNFDKYTVFINMPPYRAVFAFFRYFL